MVNERLERGRNLATTYWVFRAFDESGKHCLLVDNQRAIEYA